MKQDSNVTTGIEKCDSVRIMFVPAIGTKPDGVRIEGRHGKFIVFDARFTKRAARKLIENIQASLRVCLQREVDHASDAMTARQKEDMRKKQLPLGPKLACGCPVYHHGQVTLLAIGLLRCTSGHKLAELDLPDDPGIVEVA